MTNLSKNVAQNPFDAIKRIDENGNEYWSAKDLMQILEYSKWQRFVDAIDRAKFACQNSGESVEKHYADAGLYTRGVPSDYHLSRFACYLIAMNGDPRKQAIAMAQSYFAVKTREAEVAIPKLNEELEMMRLQNENLRMQIELRQLDNTMLALHGKQTVLALRGLSEQIVEIERTVTEVVDLQTGTRDRILSADQLKKEVKARTGQNIPSQKWFIDKLRQKGRDDLLKPVKRSQIGEYVDPDMIAEAIAAVFGSNRQLLIGE